MTISILVNGALGKMGQACIAAVEADSELKLVGKTDKGDDLGKIIRDTKAQVVIDFTHPSTRMINLKAIVENGAKAVIGTTGFTDTDLKEIETLCKKHNSGALNAPNFGIGAVLMMQFAAQAAKYMPHVEIIEYHHDQKADAPSGTAIKTAQLINEAVGSTQPPKLESEEMLDRPSQGAKVGNIRIHAVRLPGFVASQEVILGGQGQRLLLRHETINRECFMPGVILACKKIVSQKGLIYGLEKLL